MTPKDRIIAYHYTHSFPTGKSITYEYENAIVVFSIPSNYMLNRWLGCTVWELTRLWAPDGHRANLLTEAISAAISEFKGLKLADALISYADPNAGAIRGDPSISHWCAGNSTEKVSFRTPLPNKTRNFEAWIHRA